MSTGGTDQKPVQSGRVMSRRRKVVVALEFALWAVIVVGYGTYVLKTVAQHGVAAVPLGTTLIVTLVIIGIPLLDWWLTRDAHER